MKRIGCTALLAVALCAPAWGKGFKVGDELGAEEGVLAMTVTCGSPIAGVQLFRAGKSSAGFWGPLKSDGSAGCTKRLQLLRLKAGQYYIGQVYAAGHNQAVAEKDSPRLVVQAGKVNYGGDLYVGNVSLENLDEETLMRVAGGGLTVLNREPQARKVLELEFPTVLARYPFVTDASMPEPVPVGPTPQLKPGTMRGMMTVGKRRWKRGEDGQLRICTKTVPVPKGTQLPPDEDFACAGEFVTPEVYVATEYPDAILGVVKPQTDDNSTLVITFTSAAP